MKRDCYVVDSRSSETTYLVKSAQTQLAVVQLHVHGLGSLAPYSSCISNCIFGGGMCFLLMRKLLSREMNVAQETRRPGGQLQSPPIHL